MSAPTPLTLESVQKNVVGAIRDTEKSFTKLRDAGKECAALFVTRDAMVAQKVAIEGWIMDGIHRDSRKLLATKIDRTDKSDAAESVRKGKAALRSKISVYWTRLLDYAFPPAKTEKGAQAGKSTASKATESKTETATDEATESETVQQRMPTPEEIQRDLFQGTLTRVVDAIRLARECENPPENVDMVQAIQFLLGAEAMLAGNAKEAARIAQGLTKNVKAPKAEPAAAK